MCYRERKIKKREKEREKHKGAKNVHNLSRE